MAAQGRPGKESNRRRRRRRRDDRRHSLPRPWFFSSVIATQASSSRRRRLWTAVPPSSLPPSTIRAAPCCISSAVPPPSPSFFPPAIFPPASPPPSSSVRCRTPHFHRPGKLSSTIFPSPYTPTLIPISPTTHLLDQNLSSAGKFPHFSTPHDPVPSPRTCLSLLSPVLTLPVAQPLHFRFISQFPHDLPFPVGPTLSLSKPLSSSSRIRSSFPNFSPRQSTADIPSCLEIFHDARSSFPPRSTAAPYSLLTNRNPASRRIFIHHPPDYNHRRRSNSHHPSLRDSPRISPNPSTSDGFIPRFSCSSRFQIPPPHFP